VRQTSRTRRHRRRRPGNHDSVVVNCGVLSKISRRDHRKRLCYLIDCRGSELTLVTRLFYHFRHETGCRSRVFSTIDRLFRAPLTVGTISIVTRRENEIRPGRCAIVRLTGIGCDGDDGQCIEAESGFDPISHEGLMGLLL
jgi:hypothetical protein